MKFPLARVLRAGVRGDTTPRQDLNRLADAVSALGRRLEAALQDADSLLQAERERAQERASLAGLPHPTLLSESMTLEGGALDRLRASRVRVGEPVERPFSRFVGITRCASPSPDVRALWARLLALEADCDDVLRGLPCAILDVPGAAVSAADGRLRVVSRVDVPASGEVLAVPRCTYDAAARKVGNFGHWMLDYAPQIVALWTVAPEATILMPEAAKWFHSATLAQMGFDVSRLRPWDGSPVECSRALVFEHDGRTGGGRPLSPLMEVRRLLAPPQTPGTAWNRRIYVSRRDAPKKRRWIVNEREVEELFRSRGFEIVVMRDCPFEEQIRLFREARIVAGLNGGGLTDIVFSRRGTEVIVLLSDWLMRWYAGGGRSAWSGGARGGSGRLAALGDSPRFWTHVAAAFEQRCHSFVGGDELPLGELAGFLDEVLAGLDRT